MKKRICAIALILALSLSLDGVFATAAPSFTASVLNAFEYNASEWYSTEESRALFTILAYNDLIIEKGKTYFTMDISKLSYVGTNTSMGVICVLTTEGKDIIVIAYTPSLGKMSVEKYESSTTVEDFAQVMAMAGIVSSPMIKNSPDDLAVSIKRLEMAFEEIEK